MATWLQDHIRERIRKGRKGADTSVFANRTAVGISGCVSETEPIAEDTCFEFFQRETTWGFVAAWAESLEGSKDEQSTAKLMNSHYDID